MLVKKSTHHSTNGKYVMVDEWSMPLFRANGHLYAKIVRSDYIPFTAAQSSKLHRQFVHPSADKPYTLLGKACPEESSEATLNTLKDLTQQCDACQRIQPELVRFRVSLGIGELCSNEKILIDIIHIGQKGVLHIVDSATKFIAARFLADSSTSFMWAAFVEC